MFCIISFEPWTRNDYKQGEESELLQYIERAEAWIRFNNNNFNTFAFVALSWTENRVEQWMRYIYIRSATLHSYILNYICAGLQLQYYKVDYAL